MWIEGSGGGNVRRGKYQKLDGNLAAVTLRPPKYHVNTT
jgi:hypothetical protein